MLEIFVVVIIAILVCKPEDISFIIKEFYRIKNYLLHIKDEISKPIADELAQLNSQELADPKTLAQINSYLHKIAQLNQSYNGEYSLEAIRKYYYQLISDKYQ